MKAEKLEFYKEQIRKALSGIPPEEIERELTSRGAEIDSNEEGYTVECGLVLAAAGWGNDSGHALIDELEALVSGVSDMLDTQFWIDFDDCSGESRQPKKVVVNIEPDESICEAADSNTLALAA